MAAGVIGRPIGADNTALPGGSAVFVGRLRLHADAFTSGPHPNPTCDLLLADPSSTVLYSCQIEAHDTTRLDNRLDARATFRFWNPYTPPLPGPWPVWSGRVIGEASEITYAPAQDHETDTLPAMAKKVETIVTLVDDIDGGKADRTIAFAFDGTSYEIDLSKKNAAAFEKLLAPYLGAARRAPKTTRTRSSASGSGRGRRSTSNLADIREWAQSNGHEVSSRGRISQAVQDAYAAAH